MRCLSVTGCLADALGNGGKARNHLIVIGTHGRRGVEKMLLGSIAEEILRCAQSPLLMVGQKSSVAPETEAPLKAHSLRDEFSPECEPAMHYALRFSQGI